MNSKMVYLAVNHSEDTDCDLFSFPNIEIAMCYIVDEDISGYMLSDMPLEEYEPEDYTYIDSGYNGVSKDSETVN